MNISSQKVFRVSAAVSLGGFLFGFDASVISGVINFIVPQFGLDNWQLGLVVGAPTLGGILASLTASPLADFIGRKKVLLILAMLYAVSAIAAAFSPTYEILVLARFIGGLAFASLGIAPMYIGEIAPKEQRGFLVSVNQMNIVVGFSFAYFANYLVLLASQSGASWVQALGVSEFAWRWMLGLQILPALAWIALLKRVPESPRWLVMKGQLNQARQVLLHLRPADKVESEMIEIQGSFSGDSPKVRYRPGVLLSPALRLPVLLGLTVGIAQQVTGINAIYFYAPTIFEQSGVGTNTAFAQATLIGIINIIFTIVAMLLIDRLGRKPLLMMGLVGIVLSTSLAGYGFKQASYQLDAGATASLPAEIDQLALQAVVGTQYPDDLAFKRAMTVAIGEQAVRAHGAELTQAAIRINPVLVLVGILGFVASFAISLGPVMWVLFSEIFPNHIRGLALALCGFFNSASSFIVQLVFPWELSNLGNSMTFFIYALFGLGALVLVGMWLPETKGRSLEQLEKELSRGHAT